VGIVLVHFFGGKPNMRPSLPIHPSLQTITWVLGTHGARLIPSSVIACVLVVSWIVVMINFLFL
jgi:hypothetical protein